MSAYGLNCKAFVTPTKKGGGGGGYGGGGGGVVDPDICSPSKPCPPGKTCVNGKCQAVPAEPAEEPKKANWLWVLALGAGGLAVAGAAGMFGKPPNLPPRAAERLMENAGKKRRKRRCCG
jgi:hypothetical protein